MRYSWGTTPTDYTYTGQRNDSYINLIWYGSRWYDPALGRFTQPDTIVPGTPSLTAGIFDSVSTGNFTTDSQVSTNSVSYDRFAYAGNNPILYNDPSGHFLNIVGGLIGAAVNTALYLGNEIVRQDGFDTSNASDWRDLGVAAIQGAVAGGLIGSGVGAGAGVAMLAGLGMASSLIGDQTSNLITGEDYNWVTTSTSAVANGFTSALTGGAGNTLGTKMLYSGIINGGVNTLEQIYTGEEVGMGDIASNFVWSAGSAYVGAGYKETLMNPINPIVAPTSMTVANFYAKTVTPVIKTVLKDAVIPFVMGGTQQFE